MDARRWPWAWTERARPGAALGLVVLLALGLRLARLGFQPLWWDEGWSLYFATTSVPNMLELTAVDIHPPLYYLLLHGWIGLFGPTPLSVRLLSVLIGVAAVPAAYLAGRRLMGPRAGLVVAGLLAVSPFHVYYSQEVRMYGLVTLLGLLALIPALEWLRPRAGPGRGAWAGYVLAAAAALYTQYYAALLLLALNLVVIGRAIWSWRRERGPGSPRRLGSWLAAQAAVAALYAPWLLYAAGKLLTYVQNKVTADRDVPLSLPAYLGRHLAALGWGHAEGALAPWWWLGLLPAAVLLVLLATVVLAGRRQRDRARGQGESGREAQGTGRNETKGEQGRSLARVQRPRGSGVAGVSGHEPAQAAVVLAVVLAVLLACGFAVNVAFPFNPVRGERLLLLALPVYLALIAAGLRAVWRRRPGLAAGAGVLVVAAGLVSLGFFYAVPRYPDDDYRPLAARLQALAAPTDAIVAVHPWQAGYFESYLPDASSRPALILSPHEVLPRERQYWADDPARMAADLDALLAGHGRVWVPAHQAMGRILEDQMQAYLVAHAYPALSEWYGPHSLLLLFAGGSPAAQPVSAAFGNWLALDSAALSADPVAAGTGVVDARLTWRVSGALPADAADYRAGLRLVDAAGRVWAQRDSMPQGGLGSFAAWDDGRPHDDRHGLLVPAGTPPGEYRLMLRVYTPRDFSVLPAVFDGGSGGEVALGAVVVRRPEARLSPAALAVDVPLRVDLGPLRLLGYSQEGAGTLRNGEEAGVVLFWQALAAPGEDYLPRLRLVDEAGQVRGELLEKPVGGTYPTAWWQAGELVRDPHAVAIPAQALPGRYHLALSLVRAADGAEVALSRGRATLDVGEIVVQDRPRYFQAASPRHSQRARLGPAVELIGYDLEGTARPGGTAALTLYWHAVQTPDRGYYAFVHVLDAAGQIVAQHDGIPGEGELPALGWLPGETLPDRHAVSLPVGLPAGDYRLAVGLYEPRTGLRLAEPIVLDTPLSVRDGP